MFKFCCKYTKTNSFKVNNRDTTTLFLVSLMLILNNFHGPKLDVSMIKGCYKQHKIEHYKKKKKKKPEKKLQMALKDFFQRHLVCYSTYVAG